MKISVKCFATLGEFTPENADAFEIDDDITVRRVVDMLGMVPKDVTIIFVNGVKGAMEDVLRDGDRLGLFPAVGGG